MQVDRIGTALLAGVLAGAGLWGCDGGSETGGTGGSTTTTTSTVTATTTTTAGGGPSLLGLECALDSDCGAFGKCSQVTDYDNILGGGPPGGYCTKLCAGDDDCPDGSCILASPGNGQCFLNCQFGKPPLTSIDADLDPNKCRGRDDVRCQKLKSGPQVCLPNCGSDAECDGRQCDPRLGVCTDDAYTGKALGEDCDPDAMMEECTGLCLSIGPAGGPYKNVCTSPCVLGGIDTYDCGGPQKGICLFSSSGGAGDLGFCAERCTQQDQCNYPAFFCMNIDLPDGGACIPSTPCNADADCGGHKDESCVATTAGSFCMSTTYSLGTLAPMP